MTQNQIDFFNAYNKRARDVAELAETARSNQAREAETHRSNLVTEAEKQRYDTLTTAETLRHNLAAESETHRANLEQEALKDRGLNIDFLNYGVSSQQQVTREKNYALDAQRLNLAEQELDLKKYQAGEQTVKDALGTILNVVKLVLGD